VITDHILQYTCTAPAVRVPAGSNDSCFAITDSLALDPSAGEFAALTRSSRPAAAGGPPAAMLQG
jgi:hypothetical protein